MTQSDDDMDAVVADDDDFGGGDTKAHYTPVTPREPAQPQTPMPPTIAEMFQEMLRCAFDGGVLYAIGHPYGDGNEQPGELDRAFQDWYARKVLT